jgi:ribosomal protein S27AE
MIPMIVGTALALFALAFVLHPLFSPPSATLPFSTQRAVARRATPAVDALREIGFDKETGKLSEGDYDALRVSYTERALAELRDKEKPSCPNCGPRPERDAAFCSHCGTALGAAA